MERDVIKSLVAAGYKCDFACGLFLAAFNRGEFLRSRTLQSLAELGAGLSVDIYCNCDEDQPWDENAPA